MTAFTRLGSSLWDWEPWTTLPTSDARMLWLALYTTGEAKRHVPGLWQGGVSSMADAARMRGDVVVDALDTLLERGLVEFETKHRVLRLCELPDAGEYPSNGKVIRSWWTRFKTVADCGVRDAHVATLRWIIDTGARMAGKAVSPDHENAWRETFAGVQVPAPRHRGVRRLADSDTGTQVQPSLFSPSPTALGSGNGIAPQGESGYPQHPQPAVDNSAVLRQPKEIRGPETVSDTVSDTNRIPDPGSRIPEDLLFSGEGERGRARPVLALVPPYTAAEVIREMAQGRWDPAFDKTHQNALGAMISTWGATAGVTLADFALLREYSAISGQRMSVRWLLGCDIAAEISKARRTLDLRDVRAQAMADSTP